MLDQGQVKEALNIYGEIAAQGNNAVFNGYISLSRHGDAVQLPGFDLGFQSLKEKLKEAINSDTMDGLDESDVVEAVTQKGLQF